MKILVVGSGGREHAICWKLGQSAGVEKIYCAPGNAGIAGVAECVSIKVDDFKSLADFVVKNKIDLTVVGPEIPLAGGSWIISGRGNLRYSGRIRRRLSLRPARRLPRTL